MTISLHIWSSHHRQARFLCFVLLLPVLAGCVARREAVRVNSALSSSSEQAKTVVIALRQAADIEVRAHKETRAAYQHLLNDYFDSRVAQAGTKMESIHQVTVLEVQDILAESLADLQARRIQVNKQLDEKLKAAFQPLSEKIASYKGASDAAAERARQFPSDADRKIEFTKADANYLAVVATKLDKELEARKAVTRLLDAEQQTTTQRLQTIAREHRLKLDKALEKSLKALPTKVDEKLDLGPEPEVNAAAYVGLVGYTDAVAKAAEANRDYLISNSFGQGSFFDGFLKSLGKGILGGVLDPSSVKGINGDVVKASLRDFGGAALQNLKEDLTGIKDSLRSSAADFVSNAANGFSAKVSEGLSRLLGGPDAKPDASQP